MSEEKIPSTHRDYIRALATGLEVLGAFDGQNKEMTLSQVAEKMGIDRAKARRFFTYIAFSWLYPSRGATLRLGT